MASVRARHWVGRLLMWVVLGTLLTGCANATFKSDVYSGARIGLRPDEPNIAAPQTDAHGKPILGADMASAFPTKTGELEYDVSVLVPETNPDCKEKRCSPFLVLGPSKQRLPTKPG